MPQLAVSDGFEMSYRERGSGRPLLLVHGWAGHGGFFDSQMDGLSGQFRVIAPDLRGHGASPATPGDPLSIPVLGRDLADFIEGLDLEDLIAVGWSMGAMVLWEACLTGDAQRVAQRIAGLVVEDMSPRIVNDEDWSLGLKGYDAKAAASGVQAMARDWPATARLLARAIVAAPDDQVALVAWLEQQLAAQDPDAMSRLWACLADQDYRAALARIDIPTLIIYGELGPYGAETALYLERELPAATRARFLRSGHAPHLEEPDAFNRQIIDFAATITSAPSPARAAAATA